MNASDMVNGTLTNDTLEEDTQLRLFSQWYQGVHGYLSIVVCIFGIISNIMNIIVLTRKNMISSTNLILTALAICDMLTMVTYLPYATYFYCYSLPDWTYRHPRGWIVYLLFNTNFIITSHTIAMWLTVALAVFRYIVVCHHTLGPALCNLQRAKITIVAVFVATVLFCIPNYIMYTVIPLEDGQGGYWFVKHGFVSTFHEVFNHPLPWLLFTPVAMVLQVFNFWLFGVVLKVAPCVLLAVLSSLLIVAMREANQKRKRLKSQGKRAESERTSEHNRTTAMLVAVVLCFVITELPQGILAFLSGVDNNFFYNVYVPLGDVWDALVLINSGVNFFLYCIMSRQFRETFSSVFLTACQRTPRTKTSANGVHYSTINNTQVSKL